jgi:cell fate (sporulation/competence/biofilm development) regulator YlbF (YheA/YmcA/DUF963 family)
MKERIIQIANMLGMEIAKSDEIKKLEETKNVFQADAELQGYMSEYETDRLLLAEEFSKSEVDKEATENLRKRIEELSALITENPNYILFSEAQKNMNALMAEVNAEIKFCITGERPSECTHDCSTCSGCH